MPFCCAKDMAATAGRMYSSVENCSAIVAVTMCGLSFSQGLTLVHFSAQREHILLDTLGA